MVVHILRRYKLAFAPEFHSQKFLEEKKDTFTLALGALDIIFETR